MWGAVNRRGFLRKLSRHSIRCAATKGSSSSGLDKVNPIPVPEIPKKPPRLPFLKSIYGGQYDVEALTYPETLNLERYRDLESRVQQLRHNCSRVDTVRQLGLFGMSAPHPSSGLNLSDTEIARVFEHFDDPDTFRTVYDHTLCVDVVRTFGTPGQRSKYLPAMASGAVCSLHDDGVEASPLPNAGWELKGSVKISPDAVFLLFVVDGKAFVVERDKTSTTGERFDFERLAVSPDNVIDRVDLTNIVRTNKLYTCSAMTLLLKKVVQSTILSVLPKSRTELKLREFDSVLKIIAKSMMNVYVIESMIYLTTWMTDGFDAPDIELESAAVQLYVRHTVSDTLNELKMLNGRNSINEPFSTLCDQVEELVDSLDGTIVLANSISCRGVDYFSKSDYEENVSFLTKAFRNIQMKRNEPSLKYGLQQFLHPALTVMSLNIEFIFKMYFKDMFLFQHSADFLENVVLKFQFIVDRAHAAGQLETDNEMLMERLSIIATYIYAMTAVLGRSSRSYCTGIRFSDYEVIVSIFFSRLF